MAQSSNRILDEFARFMTDAAGVAKGVRSDVETVVRTQAEKVLRDLDVVHREEFEAVKEMAARARSENDALAARIAALEAAAGITPKPKAPSSKTAARKTTATAKRATSTGTSKSSSGGES
jgi:BMFP domain-containing protein YqiC